jgi:OmcA/MtrC family decaheme c-type cytochrome
MMLLNCGAALFAVAATTVVPAHPVGLSLRQPLHSKPAAMYTSHQMEAYLSAEDIAYIRPGFKLKSYTLSNVGPGKKPLVDIVYNDDMDQPLDYLGKATPGPLSISFILAWYDAGQRQYTTYTMRTRNGVTNPSADQNGKWTHLELGHSKYEFGTTLPANLDVTKTTTFSIYGRRTMSTIIGKDYYLDNINYDFRPDGGAVTETWAAMDVAACNNCHDPLSAHGGQRRATKTCVLCHTPQIQNDATTGNSFDFKVMIHKIHMGENLPSVVAGGHYGFGANADFSTVALPQDIRNCTTCHQTSAPESHIWYANPSRKACGSCHDNVNWVTGDNHVAGPQIDDGACKFCHQPQGEAEFDASIKGAHVIPTKSAQLKGLKLEIVSVTNTNPGSSPTITFKVTNGDGSVVDPKTLNSLRFNMGGPNSDYTTYIREAANNASSVCSGGTCTYTYTAKIPADATGSWTMTADCYRNVTLNPGPATAVREAAKNPIFYFPVTDAQAIARRSVADTAKCNECHETLALHGGQRYKVEECVVCHNPGATATVAAGGANEGIHFKWMVHHIHTGENLERGYVIGTADFGEVRYPGDRRDCEACHKAGTYTVPLPDGVLPTSTPRDFVPSWAPTAAACLGCHDASDAAAHAYLNIAPWGEACEVCHGEGAEFAVSKVHAR